MKKYIHLLILQIFILSAFLFPTSAFSLPKGFFAENSILAEGKWVKIEAPATGIQFIPAATLRNMGFSDISTVNVYGYGGRMLAESLEKDMPDDLPMLPCFRNEKGIYFFATDVSSWSKDFDTPYSHKLNPYDTKSYYFLSDRASDKKEFSRVAAPGPSEENMTTFTERLFHESEIAGPAESGRTIFGEDFRSNRSHSFPFTLTDLAGDKATIKVRFGAKSSSISSFIVSANGNRLPASAYDQIRESNSVSESLKATTSIKEATVNSEKLTVDITYSSTGSVSFARLDYIEVFYPRALRIHNGQLLFSFSDKQGSTASIEGCSANTRFWDVTNPADIREIDFSLSGSVAKIAIDKNYQEIIAFEPDKIAQTKATWQKISNQNIHGMETPDMLIISYDTYMEGANRIAKLHEEHDGLKVVVLRPEDIYNEFSGGSAEVTAFRKLMKMWYDRGGERTLQYCLLMGRPYYDNKVITSDAKNLGYRPMPIWQEPNLYTDAGSYSTDTYIGMLDDCQVGFSMSSAKLRVAVGRLPVTNAQEAVEVAEKIEKYVKEPNYGAWRNKMMFVADDIDDVSSVDSSPDKMTTFFDQSQSVFGIISKSDEGKRYVYDRIYLDGHKLEYTSVGLRYPTARARMMTNFNEGVVYTNYLGHASKTSWSHEKILTQEDLSEFSNKNLTFLFGGTCDFGHWDGNTVSGGESMVLNPKGGAIAMVMPSRTVYITQNYQLNRAMITHLLTNNEKNKRPTFGDFYRRGMNDLVDSNKLRFCFIGDPAITFPRPINLVDIESINGIDITENGDMPEIPALGKADISGSILAADGELDESFNGFIELTLFDAEKVVSTKEFGKGLKRIYNDRKTRLATTSAKVENGRWKANIQLPMEIENNFSPALITAYAWNSSNGDEAHGSTDNLYVYGYEEQENPDEKGPEIESFYLNSTSFTPGTVVNSNPIVFATLSDESGINISDAGIGHQMNLTLDGKKVYTDLNTYFTIDPSRQGCGSICYPLEDIEPGKHTLTLAVWDNANNSSTATIEFNVGAAVDPIISDLSTNVNPASTSVVFNVTIDRPNTEVNCLLEVFDLSGRRVWSSDRKVSTDLESTLNTTWDLRDSSGVRVARGIYLYRATVRTAEGTYSSKSKKLAVTAQ